MSLLEGGKDDTTEVMRQGPPWGKLCTMSCSEYPMLPCSFCIPFDSKASKLLAFYRGSCQDGGSHDRHVEPYIRTKPEGLKRRCLDYAATSFQPSRIASNLTAIVSKLNLPILSLVLRTLVEDAELTASVVLVDVAMQTLPTKCFAAKLA